MSSFVLPPWRGFVKSTGDALLIFEAVHRGLIPRVTRRLVRAEWESMIESGAVFVFDEKESGMRRWTDGLLWSPSRILGNFMVYREMKKKKSEEGAKGVSPQTITTHGLGEDKVDNQHKRALVGSLTNSNKFKQDGLIKKIFSVTLPGGVQHLISYYKISDVTSGRLRCPSSLPELASLDISPALLARVNFRYLPKIETGSDGIPHYRGEADEVRAHSCAAHRGSGNVWSKGKQRPKH
ncbi:Gti1/Pac2 family-domain-containing protein [Mycena crocata]|nr:Gti1/Pac2 family-domain-containing protein [Mycena crocata]